MTERPPLKLEDLAGAEPMASGYVKLLDGRVAHQREYLPLLLPLIELRADVLDLSCESPDSCAFPPNACGPCCLKDKWKIR